MSTIKLLSGGSQGGKRGFGASGSGGIIPDLMTLKSVYNGYESWRSGACSRSGQYQVLCSANFIYNSIDYGQTWTQRVALASNWMRVCCSDNGQYFYVISNTGATGIYKSSDFGVNWAVTYAPAGVVLVDLACNASGQYLLMTSQTGANSMLSSDYGVTWGASKATLAVRLRPAISANGQIMFLLDQNGLIYKSTDAGVTWGAAVAIVATAGYTDKVAISADGSIVYAYIAGGQVWSSLDGGVTWIPRGFKLHQNSSYNQGGDIWTSLDSRNVVLCQVQSVTSYGDFCVSYNFGVSWKNVYPRMSSYVVLVSNNLRYITRAAPSPNVSLYEGGIYIKV